MNTRLLNLWDTLRTSYWFVPALFALAAVLFSVVVPLIDGWVAESGEQLPEWILTTTDTARSTLAAMAGAMVAVTGTVFSITIVTLSLASQQFGPRLLRRFMYDLPTQVTLGVFLCAGFYCLFVLRVVEQHKDRMIVPHLSVLLGVVLTAFSMAALIFFIHHIAMLIQAPHVVAAVARDLDDAIERLFPEKIGEPNRESSENTASAEMQAARLSNDPLVVLSTSEGYIQAIDGSGLMELARQHHFVLRMKNRPGQFVSIGTPLFDIWQDSLRTNAEAGGSPGDESGSHASDGEPDALNPDELTSLTNETVITGERRTPRQDLECAVDELVEVAVRSLSPGINDPFTAISCIDRLGAALGRLAERKLPAANRCDEEGQLRMIALPISFPDVLNAAFNQIRQHSRNSVAVTIRLLEALSSISEHVHRETDHQAIGRHARMIVQHADELTESDDRDDIRERFDALLQHSTQQEN